MYSDETIDAIERDMEGGMEPIDVYPSTPAPPDEFEYKEIIRETKKAYQLRMSGGAIRWFPKRFTTLTVNTVTIPHWLMLKMMDAEFLKYERQRRAGVCKI